MSDAQSEIPEQVSTELETILEQWRRTAAKKLP